MVEPRSNEDTLKKLTAAWQSIKNIFIKVWENFIKLCKRFVGIFYKLPGYKRMAKAKLLVYFESISGGKANNWRKVHGLHLVRSRC